MEDYKPILGEQSQPEVDNVVRIGFKPSDLKGIGTEYLVKDSQVIAKFYNGSMITSVLVVGNTEKTVACE